MVWRQFFKLLRDLLPFPGKLSNARKIKNYSSIKEENDLNFNSFFVPFSIFLFNSNLMAYVVLLPVPYIYGTCFSFGLTFAGQISLAF
jgi:hypothetical protein